MIIINYYLLLLLSVIIMGYIYDIHLEYIMTGVIVNSCGGISGIYSYYWG